MGGFLDVDGTLTRGAVLDKATRKFREVGPGAPGWEFRKGTNIRQMGVYIRGFSPVDLEPDPSETETAQEADGNPTQPRAGGKSRGRQTD